MSAAMKPTKKICPHCNGQIEEVGRGRNGAAIERCRTCGREPKGAIPSSPRESLPTARGLTGAACSVDGCPGFVDASGDCPCCIKRAAWAEEHAPKRFCEICGGKIGGRGGRTLCKACMPVKQRANVAKSNEKARDKAKGGRS